MLRLTGIQLGRLVTRAAFGAALAFGSGCTHSPPSGAGGGGEAWQAENPLRPLPAAPLGSGADFATLDFMVTPAKVQLGRWLFFDKRLSVNGTLSCASCHQVENAYSDPRAVALGARGEPGSRKVPTILNLAWSKAPVFFWDGRAASLQEQAKGPIANPIEMGHTFEGAAAAVRASAGYRQAFAQAFGDDRVDIDRIADALRCFEATVLSGNSAYDRFEAGDTSALTPQQQLGRKLFLGKANCSECHGTGAGANFTDGQFHNLGVGWVAPAAGGPPESGFKDRGRGAISHEDADVGAFKTPTLRDISKHAPYMHDGSLATLRDVIEFYRRGGNNNPWLDPLVEKLELTPTDVDALVAFLQALNGEGYAQPAPTAFPP